MERKISNYRKDMSVVDLICLNSQGDSVVSLLSTLWGED